ncbi:MAG: hypothetical protein HY060_09445 [Proteobacteria bacterium]|nr:hypothetical protein [Pseudomonadota bacterium]
MNLFRSEEHARRWSRFRAEAAGGLLPLADAMAIMSTPRHRDRLSGRFVSSAAGYAPQFFERVKAVTRNDPFWDPTPR